MKPKAVVFGLTLFVLAASFGLLPSGAAQDETGALGGDLFVALQDFGDTNPTAAAPADRKVLELVYDSLGRIDPVTLAFVPWAATGWTWDGQKNITVTLRNDLKFDNGAAYDADAVEYSMNTYMKGGDQRWNVIKVDELTVRFDFTAINSTTWNYKVTNEAGPGLFYTEGLSAFIAWDATGTQRYSGPFRVRSGGATSPLILEPNVNHFLGRPNLDTITYEWPFRLDLKTDNSTYANDAGCALMFREVHLIGWAVTTNQLSDLRDCVDGNRMTGGSPGFGPDDPLTLVVNESVRALGNPDPLQSVPHVRAAKNPGTDMLYFGFAYNAGSLFVGGPGSQGQMLRSAIYQFVNKGLYRLVEPSTGITHGLQNQFNRPWSPTTCSPFTPCNAIVEAATVVAPAPVNQRTNTDPGIQSLNVAGIFDRDGNGFRQMSTGQQVTFSILAPSFTLDPRKTTMANDMQFLLASAQLDVAVQPFDTWAALDAAVASCTTNCFYIKRYAAATQLPDWIYDVPEIRNAGDTNADTHLNLGAASSYTLALRMLHVGHVSAYVGRAADFLPVLHFDALEGFDVESFSGWVNTFGGINNFWSMTSLRLPALGGLHVRASVFPEGVVSGRTGAVLIEVRDDTGNLVPNAELWISSGKPGAIVATGMTDDVLPNIGTFRTDYTAPTVAAADDDTIWVTATKGQYTSGSASTSVTIHPVAAGSLDVAVSRGTDFVINATGSAPITVQVRTASGVAVANARVVLRTDLPGGTFADADGTTNAAGLFTTTFTPDVRQGMTYQIIAEVSAPGYDSVVETATLQVLSNPGEVPITPTTRNVPGFEVAAAIGAVALTFALVALARRRED